jgi:hypothetical protein
LTKASERQQSANVNRQKGEPKRSRTEKDEARRRRAERRETEYFERNEEERARSQESALSRTRANDAQVYVLTEIIGEESENTRRLWDPTMKKTRGDDGSDESDEREVDQGHAGGKSEQQEDNTQQPRRSPRRRGQKPNYEDGDSGGDESDPNYELGRSTEAVQEEARKRKQEANKARVAFKMMDGKPGTHVWATTDTGETLLFPVDNLGSSARDILQEWVDQRHWREQDTIDRHTRRTKLFRKLRTEIDKRKYVSEDPWTNWKMCRKQTVTVATQEKGSSETTSETSYSYYTHRPAECFKCWTDNKDTLELNTIDHALNWCRHTKGKSERLWQKISETVREHVNREDIEEIDHPFFGHDFDREFYADEWTPARTAMGQIPIKWIKAVEDLKPRLRAVLLKRIETLLNNHIQSLVRQTEEDGEKMWKATDKKKRDSIASTMLKHMERTTEKGGAAIQDASPNSRGKQRSRTAKWRRV